MNKTCGVWRWCAGALLLSASTWSGAQPLPTCHAENTLRADVAAIDMPMVFNRLGAQNVNWQMYALWHDLVGTSDKPSPLPDVDKMLSAAAGLPALVRRRPFSSFAGKVSVRPDLRPRPLALRVAAGQCLRVRFINLLTPISNPFNATENKPFVGHPMDQRSHEASANIDDQVASRVAGFHPHGLELVRSIADDSSFVGTNANSMPSPGQMREYLFHAAHEGAFLVSNAGAVFGGEGTAGTSGTGLFGVVAVQPRGARFYRGQVTEEELRLAQRGGAVTPQGHPVIDYEATYPDDCASNGVWCQEGKAGRPILNMVHNGRIVHGDINAVIAGPGKDGSFPPSTYPLEADKRRNPTLPNRLEPFREFISVFHDENAASQAFPGLFDHASDKDEENPLVHTLHGVRDAFMINYGSGGVGAEVVANRLNVGPMHDCVDCAFEEFFLSSFAVGDPALLVDKPANLGLEGLRPGKVGGTPDADMAQVGLPPDLKLPPGTQGPKASLAFYPHDPANVHHSYIGDFVKFRNVHMGKEQHIFHLHNHQWLFNPNDDNSNYIDAQAIGPGSGYTYEIAFGGSGNRNRSAGDAVFHCHFYPHFAQGMWYLWRIHDVFEAGTKLAASNGDKGLHPQRWGLASGLPAPGARALPDGEIVAGTPIPAVVPLPGKALAPIPGKVEVVANPRKSLFDASKPVGSLAKVEKVPDATKPEIEWRPKANPGYPFWIAGIEHTVGSRPPTPPLDMDPAADGANGGLPRHAVAGYSAHGKTENTFHRLSAVKHEKQVKPVYFPEQGTGVERFVMDWHAQSEHATSAVLPDGSVHATVFRTNGAPPTPGAPFFDPCIDDRQARLNKDRKPLFFNGTLDSRSMIERQQPGDPSGLAHVSWLGSSAFDGTTPRLYKGANIQLDVTFNKLGYHFGQQRILALWEDVGPLLARQQPPEPMVLRMNTFDCAIYQHTNLVPKEYALDDYQIATPTDVIGQHIHLPKWDLPSADGSANGWNYEDGTFSPGMVRYRIRAINAWNAAAAGFGEAPVPAPGMAGALQPAPHSYFRGDTAALSALQLNSKECSSTWAQHAANGTLDDWEHTLGKRGQCEWLGARTTLQRWFSDPIINAAAQHRGLGTTFTHDHLGPSTHQQVGLYATMLTEPPNSVWRHNESGTALHDTAARRDGGPTSWQAVITGCKTHANNDPKQPCNEYGPLVTNAHLQESGEDSHREFFLQFGDFQHAYKKGEHFGVDAAGHPKLPTAQSFRSAIHPSVRKPSSPNFPDIFAFEETCPGQAIGGGPLARPCPEVISADDVGMMVVNYRNEPVAARVYDASRIAQSDGKKGTQAAFGKGDMGHAYQSRTDRVIKVLNGISGEEPGVPGSQPHYPADINAQRLAGDPYTPILRAYSGDLVRVKIQAGSHEHEHNGTIHGMKWLQAGSGYGAAPNSGWRNAQNAGLSEQFTFTASIFDYEPTNHRHLTDRLWSIDTSQDGLWNGTWGVIRTYSRRDKKSELADPSYKPIVEPLLTLAQNPVPTMLSTRAFDPAVGYTNDCNLGDGKVKVVRHYNVLAVLANRVLGNPLGAFIPAVPGLAPGGGTLTYNHRATELSLVIRDEEAGTTRTERYGVGPLHDPTAVMLVREEDYDFAGGKLKAGVPVEPLVLRASAGECVRVMLKNLLPRERFVTPMPDLNGYTSLSHTVTRHDSGPGSSMTAFNNNLIRPSHHIGLHPQLVHYDASVSDGSVVGLNINNLVAPGGEWLYQWYAGGLEIPRDQIQGCMRDDASGAAALRDLNLLRQRVADGRLLRPSVDLNSSWALRERLAGLLNATPPEEASRLDAFQPGPGPTPTQTTAPPRRETDPALSRALDALLKEPVVVQCLEDVSPSAPLLRNARAALRSELPQAFATDQRFVVDSAPLLPASEVFNRLSRTALGAAPRSRSELRRECAKAIAPLALRVLSADAVLRDRFGAERLRQAAQAWADSFAYLVPGMDRDAFVPEALSRAYAWWRPQYPLLDEETTRIVTLDKACRFEDIEFGGTNLTPPDRIKQGQKGAVGAMVILPKRSFWSERVEDAVLDHQHPGPGAVNKRPSRATATVIHDLDSGAGLGRLAGFRDFAAVHQKGQNLRYGKPLFKKGSLEFVGDPMGAVSVLSAERSGDEQDMRRVAPEDAHDAGHMGVNYGTEPMWFRFGMPADAPFGHGGKPSSPFGEGLGGTAFAYEAFADGCCGTDANQPSPTAQANVGEPATPVFQMLHKGAQSRLRVLMPTGVGRGTVAHLHGHGWRRDPYLQGPGGVASQCIGANPLAMWLGGQESVTPMAHFDLVFDRTGGTNRIAGDFVLRDQGGFGVTNGLWSIVRNQQAKPSWLLDQVLGSPLRQSCQ